MTDVLSDRYMLLEAGNKERAPEDIKIAWRKRHRIEFPYMVNDKGVIVDKRMHAWVGDREVPERVLKQANEIRSR